MSGNARGSGAADFGGSGAGAHGSGTACAIMADSGNRQCRSLQPNESAARHYKRNA